MYISCVTIKVQTNVTVSIVKKIFCALESSETISHIKV